MTADVVAELRRAGLSEVDDGPVWRAAYSSDASLYRVRPAAVAWPRHPDEIVAALDVCRRMGIPLTARGAGTSIAGNAVGAGVVLDLSRYLNRVLAVDAEARTATVQPGAIQASVQRAAAPHGLRFGPDPSTHNRCTIGGMIGNNACGSRALGYGRTSDNVVALDVVTGGGERLELPGAHGSTVDAVTRLIAGELATVRTESGRFGRQASGYALEHLLPENGADVRRALVGSEGTLALTLRATVALVPVPKASRLIVLGYPDMVSAADAAPGLLVHRPTACEGIDSRLVDIVRGRSGDNAVPPLPRGAGWLFVEVSDASPDAVIADSGCVDSLVVDDPAQAAALWRIREDGAGLASRGAPGKPAYSGWEDAAVPPAKLGAYLRDFDALMADHGLHGLPYGHFGDGCVHVRLDFPFVDGALVFREFMTAAASLVASYGGSMSGEHGDGRVRGELLPIMYSADMIRLFEGVKAVFDPDDVLNPGVLVRPRPIDADLRPLAARPLRTTLALAYPQDGGDFGAAVHRCVGVGSCRADNTAVGTVMCPSYLATGSEKDSTRGRARVLQEVVAGSIAGFSAPEVHDALDLCLACKGCLSDCPTGVDMATYKAEALHQTYKGRLRPRSHYALGQLPRWSRFASLVPWLANAVAPRLRRAAGVDGRRSLPSYARSTFRRWFARHPVADGTPVVLWVDTFTNHFNPSVGIAAVAVLEAAGYSVQVPRGNVCCGLTWISTGQLDGARRQLTRSVAALPPGLPVVGLEPSCVAVFRHDAAELLDGPVPTVRTLAELLLDTPGWSPPPLSDVSVVAQPHCHHHAVMGWSADASLLASAGASVSTVGGCCGLAGNFGVEQGHYDVSVAVAAHDLLPALSARAPGSGFLADGFSCRTQASELAGVDGVHLAQLLAAHLPPAG